MYLGPELGHFYSLWISRESGLDSAESLSKGLYVLIILLFDALQVHGGCSVAAALEALHEGGFHVRSISSHEVLLILLVPVACGAFQVQEKLHWHQLSVSTPAI